MGSTQSTPNSLMKSINDLFNTKNYSEEEITKNFNKLYLDSSKNLSNFEGGYNSTKITQTRNRYKNYAPSDDLSDFQKIKQKLDNATNNKFVTIPFAGVDSKFPIHYGGANTTDDDLSISDSIYKNFVHDNLNTSNDSNFNFSSEFSNDTSNDDELHLSSTEPSLKKHKKLKKKSKSDNGDDVEDENEDENEDKKEDEEEHEKEDEEEHEIEEETIDIETDDNEDEDETEAVSENALNAVYSETSIVSDGTDEVNVPFYTTSESDYSIKHPVIRRNK